MTPKQFFENKREKSSLHPLEEVKYLSSSSLPLQPGLSSSNSEPVLGPTVEIQE